MWQAVKAPPEFESCYWKDVGELCDFLAQAALCDSNNSNKCHSIKLIDIISKNVHSRTVWNAIKITLRSCNSQKGNSRSLLYCKYFQLVWKNTWNCSHWSARYNCLALRIQQKNMFLNICEISFIFKKQSEAIEPKSEISLESEKLNSEESWFLIISENPPS